MPSLGDTAARGAAVTLTAQALGVAMQFVSVVVLARLLTPSDFGLMAMVSAVVGVATILQNFGLSSAAVQARDVSEDEQTNLFWANTLLGVVAAIVVIALRPAIVHIYGEPKLANITLCLAVVFVISGVNTQFSATLTRRFRYRNLATATLTGQFVGTSLAIGMAALNAGVWALVAQQIVATLVSCLINIVQTHWWPGLPRRHTSIRRFLRFSGALLGTQLISYITRNVDDFAIGMARGPAALGIYNRAYQLLMVPLNQINSPLTRVALPVLSRVQDDAPTFNRYLSRFQLVGCYATAVTFAISAGLAQPIVEILFGQKWLSVAPIFVALAIGGVFRAISQLAYWMYLSKGLTGRQLKQYFVTRPLMILMILAGLPWGALGVAIGHTAAYFMYWVVSLWHAGRSAQVSVRPLFKTALRTVLCVATPCGVAAHLGTLLPVGALVQVGAGVAAALVYLLLAMSLSRDIRNDITVTLSYARRAVSRSPREVSA